jgi:hypothetical protein
MKVRRLPVVIQDQLVVVSGGATSFNHSAGVVSPSSYLQGGGDEVPPLLPYEQEMYLRNQANHKRRLLAIDNRKPIYASGRGGGSP